MTLAYYEYEKGVARNRLTACPLCGYQFGHGEPRWKHFLDDHDPSDVPALAGREGPK